MSLHPAVAAVRRGVRAVLDDPADPLPNDVVLVACSGGADSLALAAATVFEGHRRGLRVLGATVDHGLQPGSERQAAAVVDQLARLGVDETVSARVEVATDAGIGPEAAARRARYAVLDQIADSFDAGRVLLGHTRDDQAETVLLGLTRGSGGRSLSGMRRGFGRYRRPLLEVSADDTVTACQVQGLEYWTDPHNSDPAFTRVRVRTRILPMLEDELGPGVAQTLARTADQVRADVEALDGLAAEHFDRLWTGSELPRDALNELPAALRTRVLRLAALDSGAIDAELFAVHVGALDDLATARISGEVQLPGHLSAFRSAGRIRFVRDAGRADRDQDGRTP